ncbi:hypothetical protein [Alkalihalobacterium bogoriense]|uniref:hypothetical protein n=1 Tax=Alkalihalobacterium bogoriense TaxID=246272 RepID=UPI00047D42FA|nr:hypothetical protein [Alkalihalobacterium bogoriense]
MKQQLSYLILTSFLLTSGCWATEAVTNYPFENEEEQMITVLFSNNHTIQNESSFYDALLEFQQLYPDYDLPLTIVYEDERDIIQYFEITEFPTLLVIDGQTVELRIEGHHGKDDILNKLNSIVPQQM